MLPAAQRLLRLREDLFALMPAALREICDVSGVDDETVVLRVSSAGAAAKIRQTLPRIRDGLIDRGWKVNAIRIRVQPRISYNDSRSWKASATTSIPQRGMEAFAALSARLEDSSLKSAVDRLLRRRRAG